MKKLNTFLVALLIATTVQAQYNKCAGSNAPVEYREVEVRDQISGEARIERRAFEVDATRDAHGNASGSNFDLAVDGAFEGQTVVVLHLYTGEGFDFVKPKEALAQKGFSVYRYLNFPPSADSLEAALSKACQLWVISDRTRKLNDDHVKVIEAFFKKGHGVYIWGDNDPYYADANYLAQKLIGADMAGNVMGDQTVGIKYESSKSGVLANHLITTGIEYVYEGITIATITGDQNLTPLIWGSEGNVVTSVYEKDGQRLILDGGFTRLFIKWDTAGTGRYVKNAAAWLTNYERFGDEVLGAELILK